MVSKFCKFCKHGYPVFDKGDHYVQCCLSHFGYPVRKDELDTCDDFEEDEDEEE